MEPAFDYKIVRDDFNNLLAAIGTRVRREDSRVFPGSGEPEPLDLVLGYFQIAVNTFGAIRFVCADAVEEKLFALSVPPLSRNLLEILAIMSYILVDLPAKGREFAKALLREEQDTLDSFADRYAGLEHWDAYIQEKREKIDGYERMLKDRKILSEVESEDLHAHVRYFPRFSKIIARLGTEDAEKAEFLRFMDDIHYRGLCTQAHLEPTGFTNVSRFFLLKPTDESATALEEFRSTQIWLAMSFMLAIASEIQWSLNYEFVSKCAYLWTVFAGYSDYAKEIYERRYAKLLTTSGT